MIWRWDQGRTQYFNFDAIKMIAAVLVKYNGANMQIVDSTFRDELMEYTGLPFAPQRYTVKRNYKRVFECSMLATYIGNRLIVSDLCKALSNPNGTLSTADMYLNEVQRRFRYPYPAFNNYVDVRTICFPFLAMLKLLYAKALRKGITDVSISLDEIGEFLIANEVTGLEDLDYYWDLAARDFSFDSYSSNDQKRQVREMMSFIGQHSFLEYKNSSLFLKGLSLDDCEIEFERLIPYDIEIESQNAADDFLKMTKFDSSPRHESTDNNDQEDEETLEEFAVEEGKKVFTSHFSIERNSSLRKAFLDRNPDPICDLCGRNMHSIYPWTKNLLEIHHLLPLSSKDGSGHTTLEDVVGICPSCHRAVHLYYKYYLQKNNLSDFKSEQEARLAYYNAKMEVLK